MKTYYDYMREITADELYDGLLGYGLFSEKLPPVFTSVPFLNYCKTTPIFCERINEYIAFNTMRNINIPRLMGIPTPFTYELMCATLKNHWSELLAHFYRYTGGQSYPVSRIHIRKMYDKKLSAFKPNLFEMNYKNWKEDGTPDNELLISDFKTSRFVVHADISTCFPSIYTHSLPWALVGKEVAKQNRGPKKWYNEIDKACQRLKFGETHGLLIGPHASNLLSEIVLVVVDKKLCDKGYRFYRNIDDYCCYVGSYEEAQQFLVDLAFELRQYDLQMNHKKTEIEELPISSTEHWIHKLNAVSIVASYGKTRYKEVNNYLDVAIKLAEQNNNAAILNYALKGLASLDNMTANGKAVATKRILHLAILYPYLLSLMEDYVFKKYNVPVSEIESFVNALYKDSLRITNLEGICYAIYFSLKYNFDIQVIDCDSLIKTEDCLVLLFTWLYYRRRGGTELAKLKAEAIRLESFAMERYWLFIYEILSAQELKDDWQTMKNNNISFLASGI